jgi:hypothetical protein
MFWSVKFSFVVDRVYWGGVCRDAVGTVLGQHVEGDQLYS